MQGKSRTKYRQLYFLCKRNIIIAFLVILPLLIHYLSSYYKVLNLNFNLNDFVILKDIYLIFLSLYFGYLFLKFIDILRLPILHWQIINDKEQIIIKITSQNDILNRIFGTSSLENLQSIFSIGGKASRGRWTSTPEPITNMLDHEGKIIAMPDYTKVPNNRYVSILPTHSDKLVILWKQKTEKDTSYYISDEFYYLNRYNEDLQIDLPNKLELYILNKDIEYKIDYDISKL